jgi:hypothetical protein
MTVNEWGVSYNMWPLKPGYVEVYQWISGVLREALSAQ